MKLGKPAWLCAIVPAAGAAGSAWRHEWYDCIVLTCVALPFAIASEIARRRAALPRPFARIVEQYSILKHPDETDAQFLERVKSGYSSTQTKEPK